MPAGLRARVSLLGGLGCISIKTEEGARKRMKGQARCCIKLAFTRAGSVGLGASGVGFGPLRHREDLVVRYEEAAGGKQGTRTTACE
jgi:hypothetical protein